MEEIVNHIGIRFETGVTKHLNSLFFRIQLDPGFCRTVGPKPLNPSSFTHPPPKFLMEPLCRAVFGLGVAVPATSRAMVFA